MNQLQSKILLSIFKNLDSDQMVRMMSVCKTWFEIINENKSAWRRLILSPNWESGDRGSRGWHISIVELFDRKSASSLKEVSLIVDTTKEEREKQRGYTIETLERSKGTLQYFHIRITGVFIIECTNFYEMNQLACRLPNLVDLVIDRSLSTPSVRLKDESQIAKTPSGLRTLWLPSIESILQGHPYLLDSVVSLRVEDSLPSEQWRRILEKPAQTLKDLKIAMHPYQVSDSQLASLDFPNLRVSQVASYTGRFPSWMKVPKSSTLIAESNAVAMLTSLPSVSTLWISSLVDIEEVSERFPNLCELRLPIDWSLTMNRKADLLVMLRKRKQNVKNGMQVDGAQMRHLGTLVLRFEDFNQERISQFKSTGTEVVDLNSVDRFVEVEI